MTILHDAMTAYVSGLTTKRTEKEIWWTNDQGNKITVELVNARWEKYTVRRYYDNDNLMWEQNCFKDQCHGLCKDYHENGKLKCEDNYFKNQRHGLCKEYYKNGYLRFEYNYFKNQRHGLCKLYYKNGNLRRERYYINGVMTNAT